MKINELLKDKNWTILKVWDRIHIYSRIIRVFEKDWELYWQDEQIEEANKRADSDWRDRFFRTDWVWRLKYYNLKEGLLIK